MPIDAPFDENKFNAYKDKNVNYENFFENNGKDYILFFLKKSQFIKKLFELLSIGSYTQKDCSLIILCDLASSKVIIINR